MATTFSQVLILEYGSQDKQTTLDFSDTFEVKTTINGKDIVSKGWSALSNYLLFQATEGLTKIYIANDTPANRVADYRKVIPAGITLQLTVKLEYEGLTKVGKENPEVRIRQLAPSLASDEVSRLVEIYNGMVKDIVEFNKVLKEHKPANSSSAGSLNIYFSSPKIPGTNVKS